MKKNINSKKSHFSRRIIRSIVLVLMCIVFISCIISVNALSRDYIIIDSDSITTVRMINADLDKILEKANITLGSDDVAVKNDKDATITIKRAFDVSVHVDDYTAKASFIDGSVGYALNQLNVTLGENDKVSPDLNAALVPNLDIKVTRCCQIIIKDSEVQKTYVVPKGTVKNALESLNITLGGDDTINVNLDSVVQNGMLIEISRVGYHEKTTTENISYSTVSMQTSDLPIGTNKVQTAGVTGQQITTIREKYVNGVLTESIVINQVVTTVPVDEVILVGTGENISYSNTSNSSANHSNKYSNSEAKVYGNTLIDQNGNTVQYKSVLTGSGTAYTAEEGAITSTGRVAQYGYVAVDPSIIPYGSKLYICSPDGSFVYGYAIAADTGGALLSGEALVDLFYPTYGECVNFGRRTMCVYIIE